MTATHTKLTPNILLIISGSIAAYKAPPLIRRMKDKGWGVQVILTKGGAEFITPLSVSSVSGEITYCDLFSLTDEAAMGHITLARNADVILIAPASANLLARMSLGLADDLAATALLATNAPIIAAPAMNPFMWAHPATKANTEILKSRGVHFIAPNEGDMACGESGVGRFAETNEILEAVEAVIEAAKPPPIKYLSGKHIIVTAGPTHEPIDAVRYIANKSSGKQGYAIAEVLAEQGADVTLISGPVSIKPPPKVKVIAVKTGEDMMKAAAKALPADAMICAAAVADWTVKNIAKQKIKKTKGETPTLEFIENPDILAAISQHPHRPKLVIGFAAETENTLKAAQEKRQRKGCDWIIANDVSNGVFGGDDNQVYFITNDEATPWPKMSKHDVGRRLAEKIIEALRNDK